MKNFIKIRKFSILTNSYAYFDSSDYTIDNVLSDNYVPIQFIDLEYHKDTCPDYTICFLKCFKWDSKKIETEIFPELDKRLKERFGEAYIENNPLVSLNDIQ